MAVRAGEVKQTDGSLLQSVCPSTLLQMAKRAIISLYQDRRTAWDDSGPSLASWHRGEAWRELHQLTLYKSRPNRSFYFYKITLKKWSICVFLKMRRFQTGVQRIHFTSSVEFKGYNDVIFSIHSNVTKTVWLPIFLQNQTFKIILCVL